jgi:hypothetical protein
MDKGAKMKYLRIGVLAIATILGIAVPASAQTANPDAPTIQALLIEVRQLRLALEKSALLGPRMQIAMQRVQLQEQKIARLSEQLDEVKKEAGRDASHRAQVAAQLGATEQQLSGQTDAARRRILEDQAARLRTEASDTMAQQLSSAREGEIATALQNERAVLNELNGKLNSMEQALDAQQPLAKQP